MDEGNHRIYLKWKLKNVETSNELGKGTGETEYKYTVNSR